MVQQTANPENPAVEDTRSDRRRQSFVLNDQRTFAVLNHGSEIDGAEQGLYHWGTRYLSRLTCDVNGRAPDVLHTSVDEYDAFITTHLTRSMVEDTRPERRDILHMVRTTTVVECEFSQTLELTYYGPDPAEFELATELQCDFRDIFEVRGLTRAARGTVHRPEMLAEGLRFGYTGLDDVYRTTLARFAPWPTSIDGTTVRHRVRLAPRRTLRVELVVGCGEGSREIPEESFVAAAVRADRVRSERRDRETDGCKVLCSSQPWQAWLDRSGADIEMLVCNLPEGRYPLAGLPWFASVFGRDALIASLEALWFDPSLARGTLRVLAANQAHEYEPERDAEPGKILHELREGEMAALGEVPYDRYYGSVDATPLFVVLAGAYARSSSDRATLVQIWPAVERALDWIARRLAEHDGFVRHPRSSHGLVNQGWKDSPDAIYHADGSEAVGSIALCEVQALAHLALLEGALLADWFASSELARACRARARELRTRFDVAFWLEPERMYALAIDGAGRPCRLRTSNAGQVLNSMLPRARRVTPLVESLLAPDLFSGWGIRTLSSRAPGYCPLGYHTGAVWPHDNAWIAMGLARHGRTDAAALLASAVFHAGATFPVQRLPELFSGFERQAGEPPIPLPGACSPQAWSAAAAFGLLGATLGMDLDAVRGKLSFHHPVLPPELEEVEVRDMRLGQARVDFVVQRHRGRTGVAVTSLEGRGEVVVVP